LNASDRGLQGTLYVEVCAAVQAARRDTASRLWGSMIYQIGFTVVWGLHGGGYYLNSDCYL